MLRIDYDEVQKRALLSWLPADESEPWSGTIRRLILDEAVGSTEDGAYSVSSPWWSFLALRLQLQQLFLAFGLRPNSGLDVSESAAALLRQSRATAAAYDAAQIADPIPSDILQMRLAESGFGRSLSAEQLRNVGKIGALPAAATFSVPGAGKTTEALAYFSLRAPSDAHLIVVCPKNAFPAWDEQIGECLPDQKPSFIRLRGGRDRIAQLLYSRPKYILITYQQFARVSDLIGSFASEQNCFIFLDESHRIKSGVLKQTARAVLGVAHLPAGKLIMSGTPMPQSVGDLVPQFSFLYPEIACDENNVVELIQPIYVRTNKAELNLPEVSRTITKLEMAPVQHQLYQLMKYEIAREAASALTIRSRQAFRNLGRSVARLLQFVSNPSLLASEIGFAHPELLAEVLAEGEGPKIEYLLRRVRRLARDGHKVLIWSSFVKNVEYLSERLADLGAVYIHGGVDAGDEDDDETREGKIRLFHDDANTRILVANPAAASEGISLHRRCHHAISLDRPFHAAQYLQSEDRIHRFGLAPDQETSIEIIECVGTVDETVRQRLSFKVDRMAEVLRDSSLNIDAFANEVDDDDPNGFDEYSAGLSLEDVQALVGQLGDAEK